MAYKVLVSEEAQSDINEAILWYEDQEKNLGIRFYFEVLKWLEKLENTPQHYTFIHGEYRHTVLSSFPFHIIFKVITSTEVLVLAVWHTSKNIKALFRRMK